ncbi:MAG: LacI family transcriptional regulator [Clostridia bacterium]|nr:LacI family transcriptional regulator [Clostridia bacterium]
MKKIVKITDVAEKAGVAKSTVSNVLTGRKFVSDELKAKVMDACKELDFHPNFYASGLSSHKSNIIALLLESNEDVERPFYRELIVACLKEASKLGYSLLIYYNSDNEKLLNTLRQGMAPIDGAIIMSPCVDDKRLTQIQSDCIDCVIIGRPDGEIDFNYVDIDNIKLVKDVCSQLISLYGKDVYLINSDYSLTISRDRAKSFKDICAEYSIDFGKHMFESKLSCEADGYEISCKVIKKNSVFITANGFLAAGVYRAAAEKGLKIGEDVAVFALGRSQQHGSFKPQLSYAEQDYGVIGSKAVELLINQINDGGIKEPVLIESKPIFTASAKKCN